MKWIFEAGSRVKYTSPREFDAASG